MSNRFNIENLKTYTNQEFQALDDAYFKPSNQVWINIHKEIKKEKKIVNRKMNKTYIILKLSP